MKKLKNLLAALVVSALIPASVMAAELAPEQIRTLPEWPVTISTYGGTLLLSDSPEIAPADGILYQDTVQGTARLFFHHVNGTTVDKKVVVVLENEGNQAAEVIVYRYGFAGPDLDYLRVGKDAQTRYLTGSELYTVSVPAKGFALLDAELDKLVVKPNMLVNGIYDFTANYPVKVKTMMLPVKSHAGFAARTLPVLPTDKDRLRGTFPGMDRMVLPLRPYNPAEDGPAAITLADNKLDPYAVGVDATTGLPSLNYGNYGVVYRMFITGDSGLASYYINPRGGLYAGAMGVKYRHVTQPPVATPADTLVMGEGTSTSLSIIGKYEADQSLWLTFSPPGASNLPVRLVLNSSGR
ncbi:MAG: hypothetical protein K0Q77_1372 [Anaerosporomusa subterranea]|jgi:hypothetical protein|nr:hypothetical protein [Anaerosporomusa subterranea]